MRNLSCKDLTIVFIWHSLCNKAISVWGVWLCKGCLPSESHPSDQLAFPWKVWHCHLIILIVSICLWLRMKQIQKGNPATKAMTLAAIWFYCHSPMLGSCWLEDGNFPYLTDDGWVGLFIHPVIVTCGEGQVAHAVIAVAGERAGAADRGVPHDIQPLALPTGGPVPQAQGQHREV